MRDVMNGVGEVIFKCFIYLSKLKIATSTSFLEMIQRSENLSIGQTCTYESAPSSPHIQVLRILDATIPWSHRGPFQQ